MTDPKRLETHAPLTPCEAFPDRECARLCEPADEHRERHCEANARAAQQQRERLEQ